MDLAYTCYTSSMREGPSEISVNWRAGEVAVGCGRPAVEQYAGALGAGAGDRDQTLSEYRSLKLNSWLT